MKIFELVCGKVCHAICHLNYKNVKHQAKMLKNNDTSFSFETVDSEKFTVVFFANEIKIIDDNKRSTSLPWNTWNTCDELADLIIEKISFYF